MHIHQVRDNIVNTIRGKERFLTGLDPKNPEYSVMKMVVEMNVGELKRILADVEVCCDQAVSTSWNISPERMGQ
jgi:hypothetical protein